MIFFSHSKVDPKGKIYGSKQLVTHVNGVVDKALLQHAPNCALGYTDDELKEFIKILVRFHDLGKYTTYFQNYLLGKEPIDSILKQHARIGGIAAYNYLKNKDQKQALLALYLIFLHHSQLTDLQQITEKFNDHLNTIIKYQQADLIRNINVIENELGIKHLSEITSYPDEKPVRRGFKVWALKQSNIKDYYLINYLFSLLIEGDKLDASDTSHYLPKKIEENSVDNRFGKPNMASNHVDLKQLTNNELRNFCRSQVMANLRKQDILNNFIFTLTSPTGTGKTMAALDFAIKLKSKIKAELGIEARIIYALPFINIIEQAIEEYRQTLPRETEILGHYQYADVFSKSTNGNEDGSESNYNHKLMALDTWQSDIVITSFVQFFETLIGNRNKLLKKFNHYANSIIILDEVQTLRLDQMPLIGAALFFLTKFLKSRVILMTATKPKIFQLAEEQILSKEGETVRPLELLQCYENVFSAFERTKIVPLLEIEFDKESSSDDFVKKVFSQRWQSDKSCIIVCNTVKRSIQIHDAIVTWLKQERFNNKVEYLSTNIVPADRLKRIQRISALIASCQCPILVSTQVVEAGVDLDFDMGFRDIGPIDSIIQVAGRINRNNNLNKKNSPLFIIDFGDARKIYGRITHDQAKSTLQTQREFKEAHYLNMVSNYFDNISDKKSFTRFNKIFESMKMLRYDSQDIEEDRPVACFRIIEESPTAQAVFIELSETEKDLRKKYLAKIKNEISKEEFEKNHKLGFQQRIILVPDHLTTELPFINEFDDNIKVVINDNLRHYYDERTGFVRNTDDTITFL